MHPFYEPNARLLAQRDTRTSGLLSMAAYLAFWTVGLALAKHELDARFPKVARPGSASDPAMEMLRERFARGEVDEVQFRSMTRVLDGSREQAGS